jgi:chromosome partitioning protein
MGARVISVINQKGGAGKTTASMALAGELAERGNRVLVVDADAQATATQWSKSAPDDKPFPAAVVSLASFAEKLHREVQKQLHQYDYIIIDCPPSVEATAPQSALLISHLAIVPVPPAPADLWSARGVLPLIHRVQGLNENLKAVLLVNRPPRTAISKAVLKELAKFGLPLLKTTLSQRTAYQEAMVSGTTLAALGRSARPAADEVRAFADEVVAILEGVTT